MISLIAPGTNDTIGLPNVLPINMVVNAYYICVMETEDDYGESAQIKDIVWCHADTVPGQGNKVKKMIKFCTTPATKTFSQLPGAKYYGPFGLAGEAVRTNQDDQADLGDSLDTLIRRATN